MFKLYYTIKNKNNIIGIDTEAQFNLLIKSRNKSSLDLYDWVNMCVVSEYTLLKNGYKFLQFARYVRNVFIAQLWCYFLYNFTLCAISMELHIFNKLGVYNAEPFDIHKNLKYFIRIIFGYYLMSDEELGLNIFIKYDRIKEFVIIKDNIIREDRRLQIKIYPIVL